MPHPYASRLRAMVIDQVRSGRTVADVAPVLEVAQATVSRWVRHDRIDSGEVAGTSATESAERGAARSPITGLKPELTTMKRASALFAEGRVVRPKVLFGIVATVAGEGHGTQAGLAERGGCCVWVLVLAQYRAG